MGQLVFEAAYLEPMDIATLLKSIQASGLASWIRDSLYAFPLIESFHVIGLAMVFGTIAIVDLRLLGLAWGKRPFSRVTQDIMKWTWVAFALTVTTGGLMFITNATVYFYNFQFRSKMVLIALAGINMLVFELRTGRDKHRWDNEWQRLQAGSWPLSFRCCCGSASFLWAAGSDSPPREASHHPI